MNTILTQIRVQRHRNPPHTETSIISVTNFITKPLGKMVHTVQAQERHKGNFFKTFSIDILCIVITATLQDSFLS